MLSQQKGSEACKELLVLIQYDKEPKEKRKTVPHQSSKWGEPAKLEN